MSRFILDTDILTLWQRGHPVVVERIEAINPQDLATTIITAQEQLRGRFDGIKRASQSREAERLVLAYRRLWDTLEDFKSLKILKFDQNAYAHYAELQRQKIRIGTHDLRIASIVLANNSILVTRNSHDFVQVPGLVFEDWTILT